MKYFLTITLIVFTVVTAGNVLAAPVLVVEQPQYAFGTILQGKKVEHTFALKNSGDAPLLIKQVRPSCGCTAATVSSTTIQPGKKGEIKAIFNSANFYGGVSKSITVETNDPKTPAYNLTMTGTIIEEIEVNPRQLNFGPMKINVAKTLEFAIENRSARPLRIISVKSSLPQATVKTRKNLVNPGGRELITVSVTPKETDRVVSGYVSLTTDYPSKQVISVPFYGSPTK
ncbi:MAG TPA: DUF1573 domain-containing protein [Geobacteraceae bacterium]